MADNPVPDLFCPEILSDLDDIENYYIEHLKDHPKPYDSLLDHIDIVPQQEASLCETWDESWWKNSQPNDDVLTADEDSPSLASQDDSTTSAYSPYNRSVENDPSDETASQLLNEILTNCQGHYDESQQSSSSVVPTLNSNEYAFLNTETNYLLSVIPSLITTADFSPFAPASVDGNQASVSNQQPTVDNESSEICNGTSEDMPVGDNDSNNPVPDQDASIADASAWEQTGVQLPAMDDLTEDIMALPVSHQPLSEPSEQNSATHAQVVPNLQMMLLAHHREVDNVERDEDNSLEFHRSGSQADDDYDSQVVPFWDQEE